MADAPSYRDSSDDTGVRPDRKSPPKMPRWVKVSGAIVIVLALLVSGLLLFGPDSFGIGGDHGPGRHTSSGDTGGDAPSSIGNENTGLVGGWANASEATRMVEVTTVDMMTFEPGRINVSAGETVTFVVTNTGQTVHEFTLGDAAMQQEHAGMMAHMPAEMVHQTPNSIRLQPGETRQLTWRFGEAGTLEYACHEPGHYQAGMRGQITVS